jgi:hypothetical protein
MYRTVLATLNLAISANSIELYGLIKHFLAGSVKQRIKQVIIQIDRQIKALLKNFKL